MAQTPRGPVSWRFCLRFLSTVALIPFASACFASSFIEPKSHVVKECSPCSIKLGAGAQRFYIYSDFEKVSHSHRKLLTLDIKNSDKSLVQQLTVANSRVARNDDYLFIAATDINLDGFRDLYVITDSNKTPKWADYWIYDSTRIRYVFLGNFPIFKINKENGNLISRQTIGDDQQRLLINTYHFEDRKLVLLEQLERIKLDQSGRKIEILRKRIDGSMVDVSKKWF
jgi:hypothetical protein